MKKTLTKLKTKDPRRHTRVARALRDLEAEGPDFPRLRTKKYELNTNTWQSYAETGVPSAWRIWWTWGDDHEIVVDAVGPHP